MSLKNNSVQFGSLTKLLHWSIFLLFCLQYALAFGRDLFEEGAPEKIQYILLHKSIGVILLFLGLGFIIWRHFGQRPAYPQGVAPWEKVLSRLTHSLLFLMILLMPLSGILMSMMSGYGVKLFGWALPNPFEVNKPVASFFHSCHEWFTWVIAFLVVLHIGASLFHHFIRKDNILKRMLPFVKGDA